MKTRHAKVRNREETACETAQPPRPPSHACGQYTITKPRGGTYALILRCSTEESVQIGKLARLQLRRGFYVYVGSAFGPGGVRARVAHHKRLSSRPHWHIDFLRPHTQLEDVWYSHESISREHEWAQILGALPGAFVPLAAFGSSDCKCRAHLFFFTARPSLRRFRQQVSRRMV